MSACRGHADLTPGCTECALDEARACLAFERVTVAELRAEVERLRGAVEELRNAFIRDADVAERQREACANYLRHWAYDDHALSRVRATPLVTEEKP